MTSWRQKTSRKNNGAENKPVQKTSRKNNGAENKRAENNLNNLQYENIRRKNKEIHRANNCFV